MCGFTILEAGMFKIKVSIHGKSFWYYLAEEGKARGYKLTSDSFFFFFNNDVTVSIYRGQKIYKHFQLDLTAQNCHVGGKDSIFPILSSILEVQCLGRILIFFLFHFYLSYIATVNSFNGSHIFIALSRLFGALRTTFSSIISDLKMIDISGMSLSSMNFQIGLNSQCAIFSFATVQHGSL